MHILQSWGQGAGAGKRIEEDGRGLVVKGRSETLPLHHPPGVTSPPSGLPGAPNMRYYISSSPNMCARILANNNACVIFTGNSHALHSPRRTNKMCVTKPEPREQMRHDVRCDAKGEQCRS